MVEYDDRFDSYIAELVKKHPRSYFKTLKAKGNSTILEYIERCTPLLRDKKFLISTKVYWVLNKIQSFPRCNICGKEIIRNVKINERYPSHCSAKCLSMDPEVQKHKEDSYERKYGEGIKNPFQSKEVLKQIDETNFRKYNARRFTQTEDYRNHMREELPSINERKHDTHEANGSFNESKDETIVYEMIRRRYENVKRQYRCEKYPFNCDFYIPETDTYVEYNGTWTHGGHPFDENSEEDADILGKWKDKNSGYYDNAIYTWTELDVKKRNCAMKNGLKLVELWNIDDVTNFLGIDQIGELQYPYNRKKIEREFEYYRDTTAEVFSPYVSHKNEIIKYFQQDSFFGMEKKLWMNDGKIRERLILNRLKYLGKPLEELSVDDILTGFKKSGIYYGYSHFNPMWFKWFVSKYSVSSCYDPCGGWGHRLLGSNGLKRYIYNDMSKTTKENVDRMISYFKIENAITYCNDARTFSPEEDFESMFTCPPYFNVEHYECGDFADINDFNEFLDGLFAIYESREKCRVFGIVLREDLIGKHTDYSKKIEVNPDKKSYFDLTLNRFPEYLYIFEK